MRDEPDVDVVVLCETFDSSKHLGNVFGFGLPSGPFMVEFVIWIDE